MSYRSAVLADDPISYWELDETSGLIAADVKGVHPGAYYGVTLGQAPAQPGLGKAVLLFSETVGVRVHPHSAFGQGRIYVNGGAGFAEYLMSVDDSPAGTFVYVDHDLGITLTSLSLSSVVITGNQVVFSGTGQFSGSDNGTGMFTVIATDNGQTGGNLDSIEVTWSAFVPPYDQSGSVQVPSINMADFPNLAADEVTVEAWVKLAADLDDVPIWTNLWDNAQGKGQLLVQTSGGYLQAYTNNGQTAQSVRKIADQAWHHVAVVVRKNPDSCRFFIDGVEEPFDDSVGVQPDTGRTRGSGRLPSPGPGYAGIDWDVDVATGIGTLRFEDNVQGLVFEAESPMSVAFIGNQVTINGTFNGGLGLFIVTATDNGDPSSDTVQVSATGYPGASGNLHAGPTHIGDAGAHVDKGAAIGNEPVNDWGWAKAEVDDVAVYGHVLTAARVAIHFAAGGSAGGAALWLGSGIL